MPTPPVAKNYAIPSIQTVYSLHVDIDRMRRDGVLTLYCKNAIKIPIAEPVTRKIGTNFYTATPYTTLVVENADNDVLSYLKIVIETNEGVTVEPIVVHYPFVQYDTAYLLTLPRGTTGIKKAYIREQDAYGIIQNDLVFDIMEAPYNYENCLFYVLEDEINYDRKIFTTRIHYLEDSVQNLQERVTALENKAGT